MTKKNNFLLKFLLVAVMVAMMFSMAACFGGGDDKGTDDPVKKPVKEESAVDQLLGILGGVKPMFEVINNVGNPDNAYTALEAAITGMYTDDDVDYGFGLNLGANFGKEEADLSLAFNMDADKDKSKLTNYFTLAYDGLTEDDAYAYLKAPIASINDGSDKIAFNPLKVNTEALSPAVKDLLAMANPVAFKMLSGIAVNELIGGVEDMLDPDKGGFAAGIVFDDLLTFEKGEKDQTVIKITPVQLKNIWDTAGGFLPDNIKEMADKAVKYIFGGYETVGALINTSKNLPTIKLGITIPENVGINNINLSVDFSEAKDAKWNKKLISLDIDLPTLNIDGEKAEIDASSDSDYEERTLGAMAEAMLPQKGLTASALASMELDLSEAKDIAFARATLNETTAAVGKFGTGASPVFALDGLYNTLGMSGFDTSKTAHSFTLEGDDSDRVQMNLVKIINDAAKSALDKYEAKNVELGTTAKDVATYQGLQPSGLQAMIFELFGGKFVVNYEDKEVKAFVTGDEDGVVVSSVNKGEVTFLTDKIEELAVKQIRIVLAGYTTLVVPDNADGFMGILEYLQTKFDFNSEDITEADVLVLERYFEFTTEEDEDNAIKNLLNTLFKRDDIEFIAGFNPLFIDVNDDDAVLGKININVYNNTENDVLSLVNVVMVNPTTGAGYTITDLVAMVEPALSLLYRDPNDSDAVDTKATEWYDTIKAIDDEYASMSYVADYQAAKDAYDAAKVAVSVANSDLAALGEDDDTDDALEACSNAYAALVDAEVALAEQQAIKDTKDDEKWADILAECEDVQEEYVQRVINNYLGVDVTLTQLLSNGLNLELNSVKEGGLNGGIAIHNGDKSVTLVQVLAGIGYVGTDTADAIGLEVVELTAEELQSMSNPTDLSQLGKYTNDDGEEVYRNEEFNNEFFYNQMFPLWTAFMAFQA